MRWVNFFHIYQPPGWNKEIIRRVVNEAYGPLANILGRHPQVRISLNFAGSLVEQLATLGYHEILTTYRHLIERGQVELVGSAMYHPIMPLIPESEVRRQIDLQRELHQQVFGLKRQPVGFFAPEMAFDPKHIPLLKELGYQWIILDEIALDGSLGEASFETRYRTEDFGIVIRNRPISNFLSFTASVEQTDQARQALLADQRSHAWLVTAMDGENIGHHRPGVERLWEALVTDTNITTATVSEYLAGLAASKVVSIKPSSWSSQPAEMTANIPYGLWKHPDNPIHQLQWELTEIITEVVHQSAADPNAAAARRLLDRALASDKYWWASASPWWDLPIILRETQKLADVIDPIESASTEVKDRVAQLMDHITTTVREWDQGGRARQHQATYLHETNQVQFMGGGQVTVS